MDDVCKRDVRGWYAVAVYVYVCLQNGIQFYTYAQSPQFNECFDG